jgi:HK97 family phage portal protein
VKVRQDGRIVSVALILEGGAEWQQISVSPEDAELQASRRFTTEELARLYQVPPPIVGIWDHSSFTNSETAGRWFAQFTLSPWIRKLEAEFVCSVFTASGRESHSIELDLSGALLRRAWLPRHKARGAVAPHTKSH